MPLRPPAPRYVAELFAPLHRELVVLLRALAPEQWARPTVAGAWRVRDVAAHLLDGMLRTLSGARAGGAPRTYEELVAFLNELNASGVAYWRRASTGVLTDLLEIAGRRVAEDVERLEPIGVAWAGEAESWPAGSRRCSTSRCARCSAGGRRRWSAARRRWRDRCSRRAR